MLQLWRQGMDVITYHTTKMPDQEAEFSDVQVKAVDTVSLAVQTPPEMAMISYEGIGTMILTDEERAILCAPTDPAIVQLREKGLCYAPQVEYRKRFEKSRVPYSLRIVQSTKEECTISGKAAVKVYVQGQLWVKGKFVSESVGEDVYYLHNQADSYATAWEKAKSNLLVRCCKDLGMFSELWDKTWIEANRSKFGKPPVAPPVAPSAPVQPATVSDEDELTPDQHKRFTDACAALCLKIAPPDWALLCETWKIPFPAKLTKAGDTRKFIADAKELTEKRVDKTTGEIK